MYMCVSFVSFKKEQPDFYFSLVYRDLEYSSIFFCKMKVILCSGRSFSSDSFSVCVIHSFVKTKISFVA
jgi:hypothetical protein